MKPTQCDFFNSEVSELQASEEDFPSCCITQEHLCGPISHLTELHELFQASQGSRHLAINEGIMLHTVIFLDNIYMLTTNTAEQFLASEIVSMKYKIHFLQKQKNV